MLSFISDNTRRHKLSRNEENRAQLMAEETLMLLLQHTTGDEVLIRVSYLGGNLKILMVAQGKSFDLLSGEDEDPMRAALMRSFGDDVRIRNIRGTNIVIIRAVKSRYMLLYRLVEAGLLSLVLSVMLKAFASPQVCNWIAVQIMGTGKTLFMNCLNMLIPPLVFFSIASSIVGFGDLTQLGRIGGKTSALYACTTLCATAVGFLMVELLRPDRFGSVSPVAENALQNGVGLSFRDSLINIFPDNFVGAFYNSNTIQIIFLALVIGLGITMVGAKADAFRNFTMAGNEVFLRITNGLVGFMPLLIFCIVGETFLGGSEGGNALALPVLVGVGAYVLAVIVMIAFYLLLLRLLGKLNPFVFAKKYLPYMLQVVGIGSSSAAIPLNMKVCEELGIDKKVYSLSIPLGATINMDGTTIYMSVFGLLLAKLYGLPVNLSVYFTLTFTILMLSAGAPPVMGSSIICLTALLKTIGLPVDEAVSMVLGVEVIAALLRTANNAVCDMVGSLIVAHQEGLLDEEKYYSPQA